MRRFWLAFWGIWLAGGALAQAWPAAALSDDPRFLAFALQTERPAGWEEPVGRIALTAGMAGRVLPPQVALAPTLTWDGNINGGIPSDTVRLGPLVLTVDPQARAVAGLLPGVRLGFGQVSGLAPGFGLTARGVIFGAHALDADLSVVRLSGQVCAVKDLGGWQFLDLCFGHEVVRRALSTTRTTVPSVELTKMVALDKGVGRLALRLGQERSAGNRRATARLQVELARPGLGLVTLGLEAGQEVAGWQGVRLRETARWRGGRFGIALAHQDEAGEVIFGTPRRDGVWSLDVEHWLASGTRVSLGYEWRHSTIDAYDGGTLRFAVDLAGWRR